MGGRPVGDDELFIVLQGVRNRAEERSCEHCGDPFLGLVSRQPNTGRFCSRQCARSRKDADRFWSKVAKRERCWEWLGSQDRFGYGVIGASQHQRARKAHRVSWELHNGPIPEGLYVLHRCDNPPCVRPEHLYLGTDKENARDRASRHRGRENRQLGQANANVKLTEEDVRAILAALQTGATQQSVADRFGVSQSQVSMIVLGKNWSHLWNT
jgi:hypothetical protein